VFTAEDRVRVRSRILEWARADERITGAAITGSGALEAEDGRSDIDLYFGVEGADPIPVLTDLTDWMKGELDSLRLFDLQSGAVIYRVFLLPNGLEVDVAIAPEGEFGPTGPKFRTVFGEAIERQRPVRPAVSHLIGLACHHVLHARTFIERGKVWQAEHVIRALRDHVCALACARLGLESYFGRDFDRLPPEFKVTLRGTLVRSVGPGELRRALSAATDCLLVEVHLADPELAARIEPVLRDAAPSLET
jgi:hypothetical protein